MAVRGTCVAGAAMGIAALLAGCGMLGPPGGGAAPRERGTLDLSRWALTRIDVDIVGEPTTLCP
ncbi:MAG: hypothetical protein KUG77_22425, partial [Nannocystaceae bacterium]|nr:hypothetical protein [Nannocystaceae bacterium]